MGSPELIDFPGRPGATSSGNGGGGTNDARLRAVELDVREIKTELRHVATKAWILAGILGGMGVAAGVGVGVATLVVRLSAAG